MSTTDDQYLSKLNQHLARYSYAGGYQPGSDDLIASARLEQAPKSAFVAKPHILRYYRHIQSFTAAEKQSWSKMSPTSAPKEPSKPVSQHVSAGDGDQLPTRILRLLHDEKSDVNSLKIADDWSIEHQKIIGAIKSLEALQMVVTEPRSEQVIELTDEGRHIAQHGSHEAVFFRSVDAKDGSLHEKLMKEVPNGKLGFAKAISAKWIRLDKQAQGGARVYRTVEDIDDKVMKDLQAIEASRTVDKLGDAVDKKQRGEYKKRKLLNESTIKSVDVAKGPNYATEIKKLDTDLTVEMLASGDWEKATFKQYNFAAMGTPLACGHLHPLLKVRTEFRQIFLEMGFSEMPTNQYVESSFWNFDALFQPQQHPARDAHDTFFISDPAECNELPDWYVNDVKQVHSTGGHGSQGYQYDWQLSEAKKNLLRTHTTAISARMLYKLAQQKEFKPVKYFSIDRVFRNETLDATHLAEFHQVEGVIADRNVSLANLIGVLHEFFARMGITQLRFKPAYNPYTEPSMEIFAHHPGLGKWVEIGNSGVFRPEMLLPMKLPEDVNVIAWGLSLERPTMIKYGIKNIRDLFGPRVDLKMIHENAICRLDKE